jgi:SAM-dependent methyltransferase
MVQEDGKLPDWVYDILACPWCKKKLTTNSGKRLACEECQIEFPDGPSGQPDLRLSGLLQTSLPSVYDPSVTEIPEDLWQIPPEIEARLTEADHTVGRPEMDLIAWLIDSVRPGSVVLDLGAMSNRDKKMIESRGAKYLAVEIDAEDAMILGDAHAIPLLDNSVDVLICMSVFEHLKNPFLAAREIRRVLKPKSRFIGMVGFLEPVHGLPHGSFFHHSYLGIYTLLQMTGFEVNYMGVSSRWQAIRPISRSMLVGLPKRVTYSIIWPLKVFQNILWLAYGLKTGDVRKARASRDRRLSASVKFVATKCSSSLHQTAAVENVRGNILNDSVAS